MSKTKRKKSYNKNKNKNRNKRKQQRTKKGGFWWLFNKECTPTSCKKECVSYGDTLNTVQTRYNACCGKDNGWLTRWRNKSVCSDLNVKRSALLSEENIPTTMSLQSAQKSNTKNEFEDFHYEDLEKFHQFLKIYGIQIQNGEVIKVNDQCVFYNKNYQLKKPKSDIIRLYFTNDKITIEYYTVIPKAHGEFSKSKVQQSFPLPLLQTNISKFHTYFNLRYNLHDTIVYFVFLANQYLVYYFCGMTVELENPYSINDNNTILLKKGDSPRDLYLVNEPTIILNGISYDRNPYCEMIYDINALDSSGNPYIHLLKCQNEVIINYQKPNPPKGEKHKYIIVILYTTPNYDVANRRLLTKVADLDPLDETYFFYPPFFNSTINPKTIVAKKFLK